MRPRLELYFGFVLFFSSFTWTFFARPSSCIEQRPAPAVAEEFRAATVSRPDPFFLEKGFWKKCWNQDAAQVQSVDHDLPYPILVIGNCARGPALLWKHCGYDFIHHYSCPGYYTFQNSTHQFASERPFCRGDYSGTCQPFDFMNVLEYVAKMSSEYVFILEDDVSLCPGLRELTEFAVAKFQPNFLFLARGMVGILVKVSFAQARLQELVRSAQGIQFGSYGLDIYLADHFALPEDNAYAVDANLIFHPKSSKSTQQHAYSSDRSCYDREQPFVQSRFIKALPPRDGPLIVNDPGSGFYHSLHRLGTVTFSYNGSHGLSVSSVAGYTPSIAASGFKWGVYSQNSTQVDRSAVYFRSVVDFHYLQTDPRVTTIPGPSCAWTINQDCQLETGSKILAYHTVDIKFSLLSIGIVHNSELIIHWNVSEAEINRIAEQSFKDIDACVSLSLQPDVGLKFHWISAENRFTDIIIEGLSKALLEKYPGKIADYQVGVQLKTKDELNSLNKPFILHPDDNAATLFPHCA